jgi:hypothetical protein
VNQAVQNAVGRRESPICSCQPATGSCEVRMVERDLINPSQISSPTNRAVQLRQRCHSPIHRSTARQCGSRAPADCADYRPRKRWPDRGTVLRHVRRAPNNRRGRRYSRVAQPQPDLWARERITLLCTVREQYGKRPPQRRRLSAWRMQPPRQRLDSRAKSIANHQQNQPFQKAQLSRGWDPCSAP